MVRLKVQLLHCLLNYVKSCNINIVIVDAIIKSLTLEKEKENRDSRKSPL